MLDGDEAGIKSALRLITLFAEMGINGNMVVLPEGHDPDSFVRAHGAAGLPEGDGGEEGRSSIISSTFTWRNTAWGRSRARWPLSGRLSLTSKG